LTDTSAFFDYALLNDGSVRPWGTAEESTRASAWRRHERQPDKADANGHHRG
jgi:hypothetical protein